ncbi:MAG: oligosaccharide flippase family protein, partial [Cyanobacteria bacterium J06632_19]
MQVIRNSTIYLGSSIVNKAIPFILLPLLTEYLSPSEYGLVSIFQILISLFTAVVGMAINTNVSKNFYAYSHLKMAISIGNMLRVLMFSFLFVFITTYIASIFFDEIFSLPKNWLRAIPFLSVLFMINGINLTVLRMKGEAITFGIFEISNTLVNLGLSVILLIQFNYGWESRAIGITFAYFLFALLALKVLANKRYLKFTYDAQETRAILKLSLPLVPHALGGIVIAVSDRLFIEKMVDLKTVGIYTVGYMFGMIVMLFTEAFVKAWN